MTAGGITVVRGSTATLDELSFILQSGKCQALIIQDAEALKKPSCVMMVMVAKEAVVEVLVALELQVLVEKAVVAITAFSYITMVQMEI
jgi:long-subunit acyl-CoA synthetase (AMP-forming)